MCSGPEGIWGQKRARQKWSGRCLLPGLLRRVGRRGGKRRGRAGWRNAGRFVPWPIQAWKGGRTGGSCRPRGRSPESVERAAEHERLQVGQGKTGGDGGLGGELREVKPAAGRAEMRPRAYRAASRGRVASPQRTDQELPSRWEGGKFGAVVDVRRVDADAQLGVFRPGGRQSGGHHETRRRRVSRPGGGGMARFQRLR